MKLPVVSVVANRRRRAWLRSPREGGEIPAVDGHLAHVHEPAFHALGVRAADHALEPPVGHMEQFPAVGRLAGKQVPEMPPGKQIGFDLAKGTGKTAGRSLPKPPARRIGGIDDQ